LLSRAFAGRVFVSCSAPPQGTRDSATRALREMETQPGFSAHLLQLAASPEVPPRERWLAVVYLKNQVTRFWQKRSGIPYEIDANEKAALRAGILNVSLDEDDKIAVQACPLPTRRLCGRPAERSGRSRGRAPSWWPRLCAPTSPGPGPRSCTRSSRRQSSARRQEAPRRTPPRPGRRPPLEPLPCAVLPQRAARGLTLLGVVAQRGRGARRWRTCCGFCGCCTWW